MDNLKTKINKTKLFSDKEKIALLAHIDELNDEAKKQLEYTINDFDESFKSVTLQFKSELHSELDQLNNQTHQNTELNNAITQYKNGLDKLIPE